jgi:hypothetical protein
VNAFTFPRVQVLPGIDRASFVVDGSERVVYEFGLNQKRPFLFPVLGPSGAPLTRMGHPNPVGHEHHKSVWFGHQKINGINFWEERAANDVRVRHRRVVVYHDAGDWGGLAAELDWWAAGQVLLKHLLIVALQPLESGNYAFDLQSRFEVASGPVELGQTNFGFLGVRLAKTISEQFGAGVLTNERGLTGEAALFGKPSRWVDYSGPTRPGVVEGVCYMDHPDNPHHPSPWHVRRDGWMEAAFNLREGYGVARDHPLDLRYRLFVHAGNLSPTDLRTAWDAFASTPAYALTPAQGPSPAALRRGPAD